jgi:hypothetical protein
MNRAEAAINPKLFTFAASGGRTKADVSALGREIDELVYALYGLTPEEIKIVKSASAKSPARPGSAAK